jgi:hypothetical protein
VLVNVYGSYAMDSTKEWANTEKVKLDMNIKEKYLGPLESEMNNLSEK